MLHNALRRLSIVLSLLCVLTTASADTIQIPLSGVGEVPTPDELTINPAILENGDIKVGTEKVQQFTITHRGGEGAASIEILGIEISGQDSYDFSSDYAGYNLLEAGQALNFNITFAPVTLGYKKAILKIEHSGVDSPHIVLLTGVGMDVPTSELKVSDKELEFGTAETDKTVKKTITVTNAGANGYPPINIFSTTIYGDNADSFASNLGNTITINPGKSAKIVVNMSSGIAGSKTATMNIEHDGSNPAFKVTLQGTVKLPPPVVVNDEDDPAPPDQPPTSNLTEPDFLQTKLNGANPKKPTSLQFGPDGNLYVAERDGFIYQYEVQRTGNNAYKVTDTDKIGLIQKMQNRDDDGSLNNSVKGRLVTAILVVGTAANPEIYVSSADPRMAAGPSGNDSNLDTNSGIISRLTKNGNGWVKKDLVRGLPRSEENHIGNGMQISKDGKTLYIAMGGHTNMGAPSNNFAKIPEYALSAAIVEINLQQIGNNTYDLPTLDDEDRGGANDNNDPFGGNNGKNMAILTNNGPVKIYAPGFRNAFDLVLTDDGRMYTVDNGPNAGWGGTPPGNCLDKYTDGGSTYGDALHYIDKKGYYGGHPNPTRGSKANKFNNSNPQSPISGNANPAECNYKVPGNGDGALHVFKNSTNGLTEYTASNFNGAMKGDLLAASFNKSVYRIQLNNTGAKLVGLDKFFTNLGNPLDVTAVSDQGKFPGTVWVSDYAQNGIHIFEPKDYQ